MLDEKCTIRPAEGAHGGDLDEPSLSEVPALPSNVETPRLAKRYEFLRGVPIGSSASGNDRASNSFCRHRLQPGIPDLLPPQATASLASTTAVMPSFTPRLH